MTFQNPANRILRQSVVGMEGMWVKMWDPPTESPPTPDNLAPTNPVPEVMFAAGFQDKVSVPHTVQRDLLHGLKIPTWDGLKELTFMVIRDKDNPVAASGSWPGPAVRAPRGVIFHCETQGHGPPPHTIHWHGLEPTPMNDGVGHCSMEIGHYIYQFQPNFIGQYFYHCHRNTVQHFEFGLYGMFFVMPPDAYFATLVDPTIPIGAGRDRKRRIAANLTGTPLEFLQDNFNPLDTQDPWRIGSPADKWTDDPRLQFPTDPHAMTVPYDVEALWVPDDRDSVWSDLAPDARATYPKFGDTPGVNDNFAGNAGGGVGPNDFFAFNDFNADYWFITGVPVPAHKGGTASIPEGIAVPPELNSGVSGTQVSIFARAGQTILLRCLDAAYDCIDVTLPVDAVIIAWDGRPLGVPPYGHNHAYLVPKNTIIHMSVARRFDALIRTTPEMAGDHFATVEFIDNEGQVHGFPGFDHTVLMTAKIPIHIEAVAEVGEFEISGTVTDTAGAALAGVKMILTGAASAEVLTDASGGYSFTGLANGRYTVTPSKAGVRFVPRRRNVTVRGADLTARNFRGLV